MYTSKLSDEQITNEGQPFFDTSTVLQLSETDKLMCDEVLTIDEMTKALKLLPNNKWPGSDGFTTNFYKCFWIDIKDLLFESFRYSFTNGSLSMIRN